MNYSPSQASPIYHHPKQQKYHKRHHLDPNQAVTHRSEVCYTENIEMNFPEDQLDKEIENNSPYQEEATGHEYTKTTEKHYKDSPDLKQQINTSEVVHNFLSKQMDLHKVLKLIERKVLSRTYLPMT